MKLRKSMVRYTGLLLFACFIWAFASSLSAQEGGVIRKIEISGNQRVESETVRAYMRISAGRAYSSLLADKSLKALFDTGLFADVSMVFEDNVLKVSIIENPIINRIAFEGNARIANKTLEEEVTLNPRSIYTRSKVQSNVQRIVELYRRSGRFAAKVNPQVVLQPENRVDLIFEINEGPITKVRTINFLGNKVFTDFRLRKEILTRESRWWRIFTSNDNYDPDRVSYDRELLRRFYLSKGYADFRVESSIAELTPKGDEFFITFRIEEGQLYSFTDATVASNLKSINIEEFKALITHKPGEQYNVKKIDETIAEMTKLLGEKGYAFANIRPQVRRNRQEGSVYITYRVEEGPRVYVQRINIRGNLRTQDRVIRRQFRLDEGDAFNQLLLARSERNLRGLGYFADVKVDTSQGNNPDQTVIDVTVREQSTGELSLGMGYSTSEALTTEISILERNLLGKGYFLRFRTSVSTRQTAIDLHFTNPHFLERDLHGSIDVFRSRTDYKYESGVQTARAGIGFGLSYPLSDDSRLSLNYRLMTDELVNQSSSRQVNPSYSNFESEIGYSYILDKRNDRIEPTEGWNIVVSQQLATAPGDTSYFRTVLNGNLYHEWREGFVFHMRGDAGYVFGFNGDDVSYGDRFFKGGISFRGFRQAGVGPRQVSTNYSLGARAYALGTIETTIPNGIPKEFGIKTTLFTDFGIIGKSDALRLAGQESDIQDDLAFRATYGMSIFWRSPIGPVRFDMTGIIKQEEYDRDQSFRFSVGTRF
ncbi:MAG: outer membrane protein assembly factor BamA [Parvibaculales bacterium]